MKLPEGPFLMEGGKGLGPIQISLEKSLLVYACKLLEELGFYLGCVCASGCSESMETVMELHLLCYPRVDDAFKDFQDYFQEADASGHSSRALGAALSVPKCVAPAPPVYSMPLAVEYPLL